MSEKTFKKVLTVVVFSSVLILGSYFYTSAAEIDLDFNPINPSIPGTNEATQDNPNPVGIIGNLFQFALLIGGLLAFVMIVYGGIEYAASGDSGSGQKDAKERIQQALLGLLLLAGAFVLLQTINPQLTKLEFPTLSKIKESHLYLPGLTLTGNAGKEGGRCLSNQCDAGSFCFTKTDKCYANIACEVSGNDTFTEGGDNDECEDAIENLTGLSANATCTEGKVCALTNAYGGNSGSYRCIPGTIGLTGCAVNESCVDSYCKLNGLEGAKTRNGKCLYPELEPNSDGICVRISANDIACGDQTGFCAQGDCIMDRENIGKFKCSTSPGPDGICPFGTTAQDCVLKYGEAGGGYCHKQFCYSNGTGLFP